MTNRERPEEEAVKRSPLPELSTINPAKEELAEKDATGTVPAPIAPEHQALQAV